SGKDKGVIAGVAAKLGINRTSESIPQQLRLVARLSEWLAEKGLGVDALTTEIVDAFVADLRASGYRLHRSARALEPLLANLRGRGAGTAGRRREGARARTGRLPANPIRGLPDRSARSCTIPRADLPKRGTDLPHRSDDPRRP